MVQGGDDHIVDIGFVKLGEPQIVADPQYFNDCGMVADMICEKGNVFGFEILFQELVDLLGDPLWQWQHLDITKKVHL